ncbi:MAG: hypothetical protein ACFFD4_12355 [Candidatus Odinarchaeota archaeon]
MSKKELVINNSKLFWLFTFDFLKLPKKSLRVISKQIAESTLVQGWSYYYTPDERHLGIGKIEAKEDHNDASSTDPFYQSKEILEILQSTDFLVLDEEFFEAQIFTRFHLKGFKVRLPDIENPQDVSVALMLTKWGVGCLGFYIDLNVDLSASQLASLQIIPKDEEPILRAQLDIELIQEISYMNPDVKDIVDKRKAAGKKDVLFKQVSLGEIVWFYIASMINLIHDRGFKSFEEITDKQRYETYIAHPLVIIEKTEPEYQSAYELVKNHREEIYIIAEQLPHLERDDVSSYTSRKLLRSIITDREDIWYYMTIGSTIQIITPRTREIAESKSENGSNEYYKEILQPYVENEVIQIQRFIILMMEHFISSQDIAELKPREISFLKESVMKSLEIFYTIRISGNSISHARIELGKEVTLVNNVQKAIEEKIVLLEGAVRDYQESLKDFTQAILGVILGVVPAILFLFSGTNDMIKLILSVVLSGGLTLLARYGARYYWKMKQKKESYV